MKRSPIPSSAVLGALVGLGSGSALASGALPTPDGVAWWAPYLMTGVLTIGPLLVGAVTRAIAARDEHRAKADEVRAARDLAEAARLRADADPTNDTRAAELEARARELEDSAANRRANAAAARAVSPRKDSE